MPEHEATCEAELAPSLAHTLNNLLQVVSGNLELLATRVEDEQLLGYISNAQLAAEQLSEVAHGLYDKSRAA
jgi:hypothetical protein